MRVLISGAGIAGPTVAFFLSKTGAKIDIIEKSSTLLTQGQNVDFKGSAVTVIKKMGLMDQIRRFNTTKKGTQFIDPKGRPFASFPINDGRSASLTSEFEILRGDIATILYEATKTRPNLTYSFNTTITSVLSNDPQTGVTVSLSNGQTNQYDLLIAADGQWSRTRKTTFPKAATTITDLKMYTAYWTLPRAPHDTDQWSIYLVPPSRTLSLRPDPHGTIRAMLTLMPRTSSQFHDWQEASHSDRHTQQALLRREFADAGWEAPRILAALDPDGGGAHDFYFHSMQQVKLSHWSHNRVVCVGDAAHAPSPVAGGGTSLAILGAYVLAGELSRVGKGEGEDLRGALERYEGVYRKYVEGKQRIPWWAPGIAHPVSEWGRWRVNLGVWVISKVVAMPWVRGMGGGGEDEDDFVLPEYPAFESQNEEE